MRQRIILALLCVILVGSSRSAAAQSPAPCSAAAYHALDFALGRWTIASADGAPEGSSVIEPSIDGCAIIENWTSANERGRNIDAFDREDGHWYRMFLNSRGQVHVFKGETRGASVAYAGTSTEANGSTALNTLTVVRDGVNRLVQTWRQSHDGGKTWQIVFQGIYSRRD